MISTELHWIDGPWAGKLAMAARPRGGDWLDDEISGWRRAGIDVVFSLLTRDEEEDLDLVAEADAVRNHGMRFFGFPIRDRQTPSSEMELKSPLEKIEAELAAGRNVVLHCRQGIGRTGLVAACLLVHNGVDPETAVRQLSAERGVSIPETGEQRRWIEQFARALAVPHHE